MSRAEFRHGTAHFVHNSRVSLDDLSLSLSFPGIAVIERGKLTELGTHEELMAKPGGRYRRLQQMQNLDLVGTENVDSPTRAKDKYDELASSSGLRSTKKEVAQVEDEEVDSQLAAKNARRARMLGSQDAPYFIAGGIGAVLAGIVFPGWGIIFAYVRDLSGRSVGTERKHTSRNPPVSCCVPDD